MERGICKICKTFFEKTRKDQELCEACYEKDKKEYVIIKEYLLEHRQATIMDVYMDTKISLKTIKRFIEEERIDIVDIE